MKALISSGVMGLCCTPMEFTSGSLAFTRRSFIGGAVSAFGTMALPSFGGDNRPIMTFGVVSDVHIGGRKEAPERLEFALRWLKGRNVDAVLCPGDIAHSGLKSQFEKFASVWQGVFPGSRDARGRKVELMVSTGNHDVAPEWTKKGKSAEWCRENLMETAEDFNRIWPRLFGESFEIAWRKEVKGIVFLGTQWTSLKPDVESFVRAQSATIDRTRPFFYCQHEHPRGTCHGSFGCGFDDGRSVRALSPFPNAVAITGHSHCTLADERSVWQGAFTSIGAGCTHEGGMSFDYDNCSAFWHPNSKTKLMGPLNDPAAWSGDPQGGCFEFIEVFADHLVVHRRSSVVNGPIGPDWIVPIPARKDGPFDFAVRKQKRLAPQFAANAALKVEVCPLGHSLESNARKGEPCVYLAFPCANAECSARVFDYVVTADSGGKEVARRTVFAPGGTHPLTCANVPGECLFSLKELSGAKVVKFTVVPRECFGNSGRPLLSAAVVFRDVASVRQ